MYLIINLSFNIAHKYTGCPRS